MVTARQVAAAGLLALCACARDAPAPAAARPGPEDIANYRWLRRLEDSASLATLPLTAIADTVERAERRVVTFDDFARHGMAPERFRDSVYWSPVRKPPHPSNPEEIDSIRVHLMLDARAFSMLYLTSGDSALIFCRLTWRPDQRWRCSRD